MNEREWIALVDRLRALPSETEWFEFKRGSCESQEMGEYLSALANSACLAAQSRGYLLFGIDNASHEVVGTAFDPYTAKGKGNQDLLPWLSAGLRPNTGIEASKSPRSLMLEAHHPITHGDGSRVESVT